LNYIIEVLCKPHFALEVANVTQLQFCAV
jgi:hypothetical protein